jgi:hypothetical protein
MRLAIHQKLEHLILRADAPPLDGLVRLVLGYAAALAWRSRVGPAPFGWMFILFVLGLLLSVRLVPLAIRKLGRFSPTVTQIWAQRRLLAKQFDSYQWRKLFWFGSGLGIYGLRFSQTLSMPYIVLTTGCVVSGAIGLWRFRTLRRSPWPIGANMTGGIL